jgi:hypothetical protein
VTIHHDYSCGEDVEEHVMGRPQTQRAVASKSTEIHD